MNTGLSRARAARTTLIERSRTALATVADPAALKDAITQTRDALGVEHIFYHWLNAPDGQAGAGTYPDLWAERYLASDYRHIDPVVLGAAQRFGGFDWKELDWSNRKLREFLAEATDYGLGHQGWSTPIFGPGGEFAIFTVNDSRDDDAWGDFCAVNAGTLILLGHAYHDATRRMIRGTSPRLPDLTRREIDVLALIANGLSHAEAAQRLDISDHTLRDHLASARLKLDARNTAHAVALAIAAGQIAI